MGRRSGASFFVLVGIILITPIKFSWADTNSAGPNGVNATVTGLTGAGQVVGILEAFDRPAVAGDAHYNPSVTVAGLVTAMPTNSWVNFDIDPHAESVASTIISTAPVSGGLAPATSVYAADDFDNSSYGGGGDFNLPDDYRNDMVAGQKLYQLANVRAVNMSFGDPLPIKNAPQGGNYFGLYGDANTVFDGTSQFTEFVDWASQKYNAVTTIAGNETGDSFGFVVPTDAYNGLVVGATTTNDGTTSGVFDRMASFNVVNQLPNVPGNTSLSRRTIDIVAPGQKLQDAALSPGVLANDTGTSFAAPHVAGAVALISQDSVAMGMGADSRNETVQRAILLNSADKIQGVLGMDHTILREATATNSSGSTTDSTGAGLNWVQERAAEVTAGTNRNAIPLDTQLGVGQLNVRRAAIQLQAGEQKPGPVQYIGWDYNTVASATSVSQAYALPAMTGGQWISATLTWDRQVNLNDSQVANGKFDAETYIHLRSGVPQTSADAFNFASGDPLTDVNSNGTYDNITESFSTPAGTTGLDNLDLFILPHGDTNLADAIAESNSTIYNLEHIFFQLPATILNPTNFDIEVLASDLTQTSALTQNYALDWWTAVATVPEPASIILMAVGGALAFGYWRRANAATASLNMKLSVLEQLAQNGLQNAAVAVVI
jgi:hypothetical protein